MEANIPPTQIGKGKAKGLVNVDDETKLGVGAVLSVLFFLMLL